VADWWFSKSWILLKVYLPKSLLSLLPEVYLPKSLLSLLPEIYLSKSFLNLTINVYPLSLEGRENKIGEGIFLFEFLY